MQSNITEWEFAARVAAWMNIVLDRNSTLPFTSAEVEQRVGGTLKRRDLTLYGEHKQMVLTGEIKLPYQKQGGSPYHHAVTSDARKKAQQAGTDFFFTWNVNDFVLWRTDQPTDLSRSYQAWEVARVHRPDQMQWAETESSIQDWIEKFLVELADIVHRPSALGTRSPDETFIDLLESSLGQPLFLTLEQLQEQYTQKASRADLEQWMRDEQGWIIRDDVDGIHDNLERAARFSNYALVNKLVFYEALLKRYGRVLEPLSIPDHIDNSEQLRNHLYMHFGKAVKATGDYETVFGENKIGIGDRIPFYSDSVVPHWRELVEQIHVFDFTKLDYEIIGAIFERFIAPEERS